jgi:hypothetical protein
VVEEVVVLLSLSLSFFPVVVVDFRFLPLWVIHGLFPSQLSSVAFLLGSFGASQNAKQVS